MAWHLAQFNIAHMVAPLDQPVMKGFVDAIEHINEVAAGFYLRLFGDDPDSVTPDEPQLW